MQTLNTNKKRISTEIFETGFLYKKKKIREQKIKKHFSFKNI